MGGRRKEMGGGGRRWREGGGGREELVGGRRKEREREGMYVHIYITYTARVSERQTTGSLQHLPHMIQ